MVWSNTTLPNFNEFAWSGAVTWVPFGVTLPAAGDYTMEVHDQAHGFYLNVERNLPFVSVGELNSLYWTDASVLSFYVPDRHTQVAIFSLSAVPIKVGDGSGAIVTPSYGNGRGMTLYNVPSGQDGTVFRVQPGEADNTERTWLFEGGEVDLLPDTEYLITTPFEGASTTGQFYYVVSPYVQSDHAAAGWGGTQHARAIQSGGSNNWITRNDYVSYADLWFKLHGDVLSEDEVGGMMMMNLAVGGRRRHTGRRDRRADARRPGADAG